MRLSVRSLVFASIALVAASLAGFACSSSSDSPGSFGPTDEPDGGDQLVRNVGATCTSGVMVCELDSGRNPTGNALVCQDGKLALAFACPSGATCGTLQGNGGVQCGGVSLANLGGACDAQGSAACASDHSSVVLCQDDVWVTGHHCGGATCDFFTGEDGTSRAQCGQNDVYSVGDLCSFPTGHGVCSADGKSVLDCGSDGKTEVLYACAASQECENVTVDAGTGVECYPPK